MNTTHSGPHKYKRRWMGKNKDYEVYACVKPNCMHYIRPEHLEGKQFECWRCGKVNTASVATKKLAKPHCKSCTKNRDEIRESFFKSEGHLPILDLEDL